MAPSGADADGDGAGDAFGEEDGPLQHLHAADGGADGELEALDAEVVDELDLGATMSRTLMRGKVGP